MTNSELVLCLRSHLEQLACGGKTISYRQLAIVAQISEPKIIRQVAEALEEIIREDHAAGIDASIASLVVSQSIPAIPRAGFFMLLRELKVYAGPDEGEQALAFHAGCIQQVFARYA